MEKLQLTGTWLIFLFGLQIAFSERSVYVKHLDQQTTSSTLKWISSTQQQEESSLKDLVVIIPSYEPDTSSEEYSYESPEFDTGSEHYICQAKTNTNFVPGWLNVKNSTCVVPLLQGQVQEASKYEVLENVNGAARLKWVNWHRHQKIPSGAVSSGKYFICRVPWRNVTFLAGGVDLSEDSFGRVSVTDKNNKWYTDFTEVQLLVEIEPVSYELRNVKLRSSHTKITSRNTTVLGKLTLNGSSTDEIISSAISYSWKYFTSWGRGEAMLKGLSTRAYEWNSTFLEEFLWGLHGEQLRNATYKVQSWIPAGAAREMELYADYLTLEVPYSAILVQNFEGNVSESKTIREIRRYTDISNISLIYRPLYFIENGTLVPTPTTTDDTIIATFGEGSRETDLSTEEVIVESSFEKEDIKSTEDSTEGPTAQQDTSNVPADDSTVTTTETYDSDGTDRQPGEEEINSFEETINVTTVTQEEIANVSTNNNNVTTTGTEELFRNASQTVSSANIVSLSNGSLLFCISVMLTCYFING